MVKFRSPPVVELSISFEFEPNELKTEWDLDLLKKYVEPYRTELPRMEADYGQSFEVKLSSPNEISEVIRHRPILKCVRLSNEEQSRFIQVRDDKISYHIARFTADYPGYDMVREQAQEKLSQYIRVFQPKLVRHASIHYVDIVDIPVPLDGKIDIADYFTASADLPEKPFGPVHKLLVQFLINCPEDVGPLSYQLMSLSAPEVSNVLRFRVDWEKRCEQINSPETWDVLSRLDKAHEYLVECFQASFTPKALQLFDPIED